jgi:hypothetical protein
MTSPEFLLLYVAAFCYLIAALIGFSTVGPRADLSPRAGAALLAAGAAFHLASFNGIPHLEDPERHALRTYG